ncbi:unnamed protein product [Peniophora sp. CBMAI 1063]|nr:unnamed protein product [Peniophora sp. CBMAI 1063]
MDRLDDINFRTTVNLLPGTHHIKFIVDDVWRVADSLPAAVDDDGSLANYIDVAPPAPASTPSQPTSPLPTTADHGPLPTIQAPPGPQPHQFQGGGGSFWSSGGSETGFAASSGTWTDVIPPALIAAAHEEEMFLADHSSAGTGATAPRIPPAPLLPRHLDKLILNARPPQPRGEREGRSSKKDKDREGRERDRDKEREKDKGDRAERGSRTRGAAPVPVPELDMPEPEESRAPGMKTRLRDGGAGPTPALADDASVLPVPNHVVLHHLSTSAIRNGVLAVGNTTRYRKKFITTVYYKPT